MTLRFTISLHQVGEAFTRDGDHLDWFFQIDADPRRSVACFSSSIDVGFHLLDVSTVVIPAARLPEHRAAYLDYEGEVRGNRGSVSRWITGDFEWISLGQPESRVRLQSVERVLRKSATRLDGRISQLFERLRETPIILLESTQ